MICLLITKISEVNCLYFSKNVLMFSQIEFLRKYNEWSSTVNFWNYNELKYIE